MGREKRSGPRVVDLARFVWRHPANRGRRLRALCGAAGWQAWKRATGRPRTYRLPQGFGLVCHPDNPCASLAIYCGGRPDYHEMRFLEEYLRPGDGFLDVGANVGLYACLAAAVVGPTGRVAAFEPSARTRARLAENVALNGTERCVTVHSEALGDRAGRVRFTSGADAQNRIVTDADDGVESDEVEGARLDDLLREGSFAAGKMDVEGAELSVLRGARAHVERENPPVWILEVNASLARYGADEAQLAAWLAERGYELGTWDADARVCETGPGVWRDRQNVLAVSRTGRERIAERIPGASFRTAPGRRSA